MLLCQSHRGKRQRERERGQARDKPEQEERDLILDSLLMREEDIVREKEQQLRKRAREGASEEADGPVDKDMEHL